MSFIPYLIPVIGILLLIELNESRKISTQKWLLAGLAFIIGVSIFSLVFLYSKAPETNLRVVGYASKLFDSDIVKWNISLARRCQYEEINDNYSKMNADINAFRTYLTEQGIKAEDINIQPITINPVYEDMRYIAAYNLNQGLYVLSKEVDKIEAIALKPDFFTKRSIIIEQSNLSYYYSKLPELKKQLLSEATSDAVERAKEISHTSRIKLGKMKDAKSGVFQINEPYSPEVSDWGNYSTNTKKKSISVTLTASFALK